MRDDLVRVPVPFRSGLGRAGAIQAGLSAPHAEITGLSIVTDAFAELNAFDAGDAIPADDAAFGMQRLNQIVDLWNAGAALYGETFERYALTPALQPHTIGPTGDFIAETRPERIDAANLILGSGATARRAPLDLHDRDWWIRLATPDATGTPTDLYYDPLVANGALYLSPIPDAAYTLELMVRRLLEALRLTDTILLPAGYQLALTKTLAEDLAGPYGATISPQLARMAGHARAQVIAASATRPALETRDAGLPGGGGYFDYHSRTWL
jgi:hypothetical protein